MSKKATWIHLAGNPPNIKRQAPPYWRIRIGEDGKEYPIDGWVLSGMGRHGNPDQGMKIGASFLLWWALYGELTVKKEGRRKIAHVRLRPHEAKAYDESTKFDELTADRIQLFGAPDLVSQGRKVLWRCSVDEEEFEIGSFSLLGQCTEDNVRPGDDIVNLDPLRRLWLEFSGRLTVYQGGHAKIILS